MSRAVYLVRHASAERRDDERWPDDASRPLTVRGARRFRVAARGLAASVARPDVVLASRYTRAWETAVILHEVAGWAAPLAEPALEPDGDAGQLAARIAALPDERVALVGHEPLLHELAAALLTRQPGPAPLLVFGKGAVACLAAGPGDEGDDASWCLEWHIQPRLLRALGRTITRR